MSARDDLPVLQPLTPAQWTEVLRGRRVRVLVSAEMQERWKTRSVMCLSCDHIGAPYGDPRRAWCTKQKMLVSNAFPRLCPEYASA